MLPPAEPPSLAGLEPEFAAPPPAAPSASGLSRRRLLRVAASAVPALALAACGGANTVSSGAAAGTATVSRASAGTAAPGTTRAPGSDAAASSAKTSGSATVGPVSSTASAPRGATTIAYWRSLTGPRGDAQDKLAQQFNDSQSAIHVDVTYQGVYADAAKKFTAAIAGGVAPDCILLTVDSFMPGFARAGALLPLDALARQGQPVSLDAYVPGLLKNGVVDGKLYQLPLARSTPLLYYNKDTFNEVGLSAAPKTWTELRSIAPRLVKRDASGGTATVARWAYDVSAYWWTFASVLWSFGGRFSDESFTVLIDQPEAASAAAAWSDLVNKDGSARMEDPKAGGAIKAFTTAAAALYTDSTANLSQVESDGHFAVGCAFMPGEVTSAVPAGGSGLCLVQAAPAERQTAAWTFMAAMTSMDSAVYFAQQTGYMQIRTDAAQAPSMQQYYHDHPNFKVSVDQAANIHDQDPVTQLPQSTDLIQSGLSRIVAQRQPAQDVWRDIAGQLRALVDKFRQGR